MVETIGFVSDWEFNVPSRLKVADDLILNHFYASLSLSHTGEGVLVRGRVETSVSDACSRCMDDIWLPIEFQIEELFSRQLTPDLPYFIDDNGDIDLAPLIREEAVLHTPMVTPYDKKGRCVFCHRTWNDVLRDAGIIEDEIDPRLAALQKLKQQLEDQED